MKAVAEAAAFAYSKIAIMIAKILQEISGANPSTETSNGERRNIKLWIKHAN